MPSSTRLLALALTGVVSVAPGTPPAAPQDSGDGAGGTGPAALAEGPGRQTVYAACSGCHSIRMVTQQRLSRARWDRLLDWMVDKQGMPEPAPETREKILNYLAEQYGPGERRGRTPRR